MVGCGRRFAVDQPVQKVQDVRLCRRAVAQRQLDGAQHRLLIVVQNERQDLHHLPVAAGLLEKMLSVAPEGIRKVGERRAVTQGAGLALDHRQVVAPIIDGAAGQMM